MKRRERIITSESQIPDGWVAMRNYKDPDYCRIKKATHTGEIDSLALYPDGIVVSHPRKYVCEKQAAELLDNYGNRGRRAAKDQAPRVAAVSVDESLAPTIRDLAATIDLLSTAVGDLSQQLKAAHAAQGERDLFSVMK